MKTRTEKRENTIAAANTLSDLAQQAGKLGLPNEESELGKPGLPEPEPEDESYSFEEDTEGKDGEQSEQATLAFTKKDRSDLDVLEKKVDSGTRQAAEAIRAIRWRQLWRLIVDDQGKQRYPNFDDYCHDRLGHSRQWVTHLTNWLRVMEEGEALGISVPLTVKAAQGLLNGSLSKAGGLRAVLEEAKENGVPMDRDHLREIVLRRTEFQDGEEGMSKPAARTYADYRQDLKSIKELGVGKTSLDVVNRSKALGGDFAANLYSLCKKEQVIPRSKDLLAILTGSALNDVITKLKEIRTEQQETEKKKELLSARRKQIRELQQEGGLKKLKEEAKALERELKPKKASDLQSTTDGGSPSAPTEENEDANDSPDEAASLVLDHLADALDCLDDAQTCDLPNSEEELNAILLKARECAMRLGKIIGKAKQMLAAIPQLVAVESGRN